MGAGHGKVPGHDPVMPLKVVRREIARLPLDTGPHLGEFTVESVAQ